MGDKATISIKQPDSYDPSLDLQYSKPDFTPEEMDAAERALNEEIAGEGIVLLKNDDNTMPFPTNTTFSFFGRSALKLVGNTLYETLLALGFPTDPGTTLKTVFQESGFGVNETLWNFYESGNGSRYGLGIGSLNYGESEDFSINECPLDVTFIKHFAVNDQENHRGDGSDSAGNVQMGLATWANEQAIREIYLLPFEMCVTNDPVALNYVEADGSGGYRNTSRDFPAVTALMTSFNRLGCTWTGGCYPLITNVLREEWGFDGFVITDAAHTRPFMDAYQMIEAGGNAKLTNADSSTVPFTFEKDNAAHYHYGREAMHGILCAVANSKAMNGLMPGSTFTTPKTMAEKILIGIDVVGVLLILALGWCVYRGFRKWRKQLS